MTTRQVRVLSFLSFSIFSNLFYLFFATVGYSTLISESKMIVIRGHEVVIGGSLRFHGVLQADVLRSLTKKVKRNQASLNNWRRM